MKIDLKFKLSLVLVVVVVIMLLSGNMTMADPVPPQIQLTLTQMRQDSTTAITMDVYLSSGTSPLSGRPISFILNADFFGSVPVVIGNSITDAGGQATVFYQPPQEGVYSITARFTGDSTYSQTQSTQTIEIAGPIVAYSPPPIGLAKIGQLTLEVVGLLVVAIWGLIIFVLYSSVFGISRARNKRK